jgi:carbon-monoxide dehydrogenase large subunit
MASLEPRGATASYDAAADGYLLRSCSQSAGVLRDHLAGVMGIAPDRLRVISEDVGGAFGMKTLTYPEYPALLVAARKLGRPVHWMSTRAEAFLSDNQARDLLSEAELALDADGRFLALRVRNLANVGAYVTGVGAHIPTLSFSRCLPTVYAIPKIALEVRCVFTNTVPTGPYRGAGRPEANYVMERLVEEAARVSGIDRAALRRKNFIAPSALPYRNALGGEFDSGEFEAIFDETLRRARYADFPRRRAEAERRGKLRGFGISCFLEHAGAQPKESAAIVFPGGSELSLQLGVGNTGQGHATAFSRFLAGHLGIDAKHVRVRQGDSRYELAGYASVGSRSAMTAGNAAARAAEVMLAKGKAVAATLLEAAETDIEYRGGLFAVKGTDRRLSLFEVAERAKEQGESLDTKLTTETPITYPNGCHVAEVEIDPDTGKVAVVAYAAVDDCGTVLDHTLVEGQVQGGVAQGLGQTLLEHMVYDGAGQPVTGTFMDYAMPRADEVPSVAGELHPVPARTNPLGIKGVGEAGTTASLAAIINALNDAIPGAALDMPATPEKVWRACQNNLSPPPERGTSSADAKRRRAGRGRARR